MKFKSPLEISFQLDNESGPVKLSIPFEENPNPNGRSCDAARAIAKFILQNLNKENPNYPTNDALH